MKEFNVRKVQQLKVQHEKVQSEKEKREWNLTCKGST